MANKSRNFSKDDEKNFESNTSSKGKSNKSGKKSNKRNKGKKDRSDTSDSKTQIDDPSTYRQDPEWYYIDKLLAEQVTQVSFNQFLGHRNVFSGNLSQVVVPSSMRIYTTPSPGWCQYDDPWSAGINIAATKLRTQLSANNAKPTIYTANDIGCCILAVGQVIAIAEWLRRGLGLAFTYNKRNWGYPKEIIEAAGFEADDLLDHLAEYRLQFNVAVNSINQIAFPAHFTYFKKCAWIYSSVYIDAVDPMAQTYMFVPSSTWQIQEASVTGTQLHTKPILQRTSPDNIIPERQVKTFGAGLAQLKQLIQSLLNSETLRAVYSDVLRLLPEQNMVKIPFATEDYIVMPTYNPMILLMINNAVSFYPPNKIAVNDPLTGITSTNDVISNPETGALVHQPQFNGLPGFIGTSIMGNQIMNFHHSEGNPDVDQKIEATRLMKGLIFNGQEVSRGAIPDFHVTGLEVQNVYADSVSDLVSVFTNSLDFTNASNVPNHLKAISQFSKFEYAPRLYSHDQDSRGAATNLFGDLDYFTTVDADWLFRSNQIFQIDLFTLR